MYFQILQVVGDITNEDTLKEIIDKTVQTFGKIDVLVSDAYI